MKRDDLGIVRDDLLGIVCDDLIGIIRDDLSGIVRDDLSNLTQHHDVYVVLGKLLQPIVLVNETMVLTALECQAPHAINVQVCIVDSLTVKFGIDQDDFSIDKDEL